MKNISRGGRPMNRSSSFKNRGASNINNSYGSVAISPFVNNMAQPATMHSSEHLQLHELDLELALLKRKREIIEQQQQMLSNNQFGQTSRYTINEPQSFNRQQYASTPTHNFSQMYDSPTTLVGNMGRQQGMKRQAEDKSWQSNSAPKRFGSGGSAAKNKPRNRPPAFQRYESNQPKPLMGTNWPKPSPKNRNDFNPTKVSKPKASFSSTSKLKTYPVAERNKLVSEASSLVKPKPELDLVLHADKPLSKQVSGRLELALGSIFKEMMESRGADETHLSYQTLREMKQSIRDRIRDIMTGKRVSAAADVIKAYREVYSKDADKEIMVKAMENQQQHKPSHMATAAKSMVVPKRVIPDNPGRYFKINFNRLLNSTLTEMLNKLKDFYENENVTENVNEIIEAMKNEGEKLEKDSHGIESTDDDKRKESDETVPMESDEILEKKTDEKMEKEIDPKGIDVNNDKNENKTEEEIVEKTDNNMEHQNESLNSTSGNNEEANHGDNKAEFYDKIITTLLRHKLPNVLPKFREAISALINVNKEYTTARAALVQESVSGTEKDRDNGTQEMKAGTEVNVGQKPMPRHFPYFAKVIGRPALPKRRVMQNFLNKYNPCSIKKHRAIHNLLFVSFNDQADYEAILADNEIIVGGSTIEIKMGEQKHKENSETKDTSADVIIVEDTTPTVLIDGDLDDQISSLLSNITEEEKSTVDIEKDNSTVDIEKEKSTVDIEKENVDIEKEKSAVDIEKEKSTVDIEKEKSTIDIEKEKRDIETKPDEIPTEDVESVADDGEEEIKTDETNGINDDTETAKKGEVEEVQEIGRTTRTSARLASNSTPSAIRTRRASKAQNN